MVSHKMDSEDLSGINIEDIVVQIRIFPRGEPNQSLYLKRLSEKIKEFEYMPKSKRILYKIHDKTLDCYGEERVPPREYNDRELKSMSEAEREHEKMDQKNVLKATIYIFSSGKIMCNGLKSLKAVDICINKLLRKFKEAGIATSTPSKEVQTIIASSGMGYKVNLDFLAEKLKNAEYEFEYFPAIIIKDLTPKITLFIYRSGKIKITGAKNFEDLKFVVQEIKKQIESFGKAAKI